MPKRIRQVVNTVFTVQEFVEGFEFLNYREICYGCVHEVASFDTEPCCSCKITHPTNFTTVAPTKRVRIRRE